ncbi:MAG: DedA family protein [Microbacteriaceae bacterium]
MFEAAGVLDPGALIEGAGAWALLAVSAIVFIETGLLIGFLLPGDTLLVITGVLAFQGTVHQPIWLVSLCIMAASIAGNQTGYQIGKVGGPAVFTRSEKGLLSKHSVDRTEAFFHRWGPLSLTIGQYVPIIRTLLPVAAGIGRMNRRTFTVYNALGSLLWAGFLPFFGWGIAHIPGVAELVTQYIDIVLLGVVGISVVSVGLHWLKERRTIAKESGAKS